MSVLDIPPSEAIKLVAAYLSLATTRNDLLVTAPVLQRFSSKSKPTIDLIHYLTRILKYAPCGTECFIAVLLYLEKMSGGDIMQPQSLLDNTKPLIDSYLPLGRSTAPLVINAFNIHRLLLTGILISVKFMSDVFFTNEHVARVGGIPVNELNRLELEFLIFNDFDLLATQQQLEAAGAKILLMQDDVLVSDVEILKLHNTYGPLVQIQDEGIKQIVQQAAITP